MALEAGFLNSPNLRNLWMIARAARPALRTLLQEEGAADAAPLPGFNQVVPPGNPPSAGPLTRSGCDPAQRLRDPVKGQGTG
jgi:hypothetical protein